MKIADSEGEGAAPEGCHSLTAKSLLQSQDYPSLSLQRSLSVGIGPSLASLQRSEVGWFRSSMAASRALGWFQTGCLQSYGRPTSIGIGG